MKVGIMYSGGKDSNYAVYHAQQKGWDIRYLLSVKPTRTDCFLFHFATVEHTIEQAEMLGAKHILTSCDVADPVKEANIVYEIVKKQQEEDPIDAMLLGGTGLQETQLRSIQNALRPLGIEVFAAHAGEDHDKIIEQMINKGFEIMITQVASDGLMPWLGKTLTKENFEQLKADSVKYKFHIGFEGGYADTFVLSGPHLSKKLVVDEFKKVQEDDYCGHIVIEKLSVVDAKEVASTGLAN